MTRRLGTGAAASIASTIAIAAAALAAGSATAIAHVRSSGPTGADLVAAVTTVPPQVIAAATNDVQTVLSYDYHHLDSDFAKAQQLLTPTFRQQYEKTTEKAVRPTALKYHAITTAQVSAAGVIQATADRAQVLVFVNQISTNTQLTAPRLDRTRIQVTLVRAGNGWLIDALNPL